MKRIITNAMVIVFLIGCLFCAVVAERYLHAVYWIGEGVFSKAASYVDEFPFFIELFDPGFVSYAYAGEAMVYGRYEEAMMLLQPLAESNYRDSAGMLAECMEHIE